ncbi:hypothetical protein EZS27_018249 [termite gut metagenome]|uniref:Uncharacterized protein n=1 Tax=termite gut metagenome TaxID=433724 RepID=A0A5J4RI46_9ZZZZ
MHCLKVNIFKASPQCDSQRYKIKSKSKAKKHIIFTRIYKYYNLVGHL